MARQVEPMDERNRCEDRTIPPLVPPAMLETGRDHLIAAEPQPGGIRPPAPFVATRFRLVPDGGREDALARRPHARP